MPAGATGRVLQGKTGAFMVRFRSLLVLGALSATLALGCGDKQNPAGDFQTACGSGASGGTVVSYKKTIAPMLAASCTVSGCHGGASPVMGIGLDTYDKVTANLAAANAAIQDQSMPLNPGVPLTDLDRQNFQSWVNSCAPNN
jgi:uncharacterized membrane protein